VDFARAGKTLREAWADWMLACDFTPGTKAKYGRAFDDLLSYLSVPDVVPSAVTYEQAAAYVAWLNTKATNAKGEPLDPETKQGRAMALSSFWGHLEQGQLVPRGSNPWRNHSFTGARQKARRQKDERPFTPEEMLALIGGPERGDNSTYTKRTMLQLHALGFYTGARLDEICARTVDDFDKCKGGYVMHIRESKSPAGVRSLPILHSIPVAVIRERIGKRKGGLLFTEFVAGGPDGKRSWQIQKAMGDYRRTLGFPKGVNFHSTRHSFATVMEKYGVDPRWVERYFGHKPPGLIGKVYAKGAEESLRKVAQAVKYSGTVERAFAKALGVS
jgi:integrase